MYTVIDAGESFDVIDAETKQTARYLLHGYAADATFGNLHWAKEVCRVLNGRIDLPHIKPFPPEPTYEQALEDVEAFARLWAYDEDGEVGTGEAFTLAVVVDALRRGEKAQRTMADEARAERTWQRIERRVAAYRLLQARAETPA